MSNFRLREEFWPMTSAKRGHFQHQGLAEGEQFMADKRGARDQQRDATGGHDHPGDFTFDREVFDGLHNAPC